MTKSFTLGKIQTTSDRRTIYLSYLASAAWAAKRQAVLERDAFTCQTCGAKASDGVVLEVHHWNYANLGDEPLDDLETFCHDCHRLADIEREANEEEERWNNRVRAYASKRWGWDWSARVSFDHAEQSLEDLIEWEGGSR